MTLLPGLDPVVPGYWITLRNPHAEAFVTVNKDGQITGVHCTTTDELTREHIFRFASYTVRNMISAHQGLRP